jgi:hypothetical protein
MRPALIVPILVLLTAASPLWAGEEWEWTLSGSIGAEVRLFFDSPQFAGQFDGAQPSAMLAPEMRWRSSDRRHQFKLSPFGRIDGRDDERTHFDLREAYYRYAGDRIELLAGFNQVFWGVTESRHLVDIINQRDAVEDVDEEDKLGQPMINLATQLDWGRIDLYALTGFRDRTWVGPDGRLRPPLPVDGDATLYESGAGSGRVDWAARWSHYMGDWDFGVHLFHGTGREPLLLIDPPRQRIIPKYVVTTQGGIDLQYTKDAWLLKFEGLARSGQGSTFGATVAGFEYTLYQIGSSAADLGLLFEYLYDGRDDTAFPTIYDDDLFLGARLGFNDVQDSALLLGAVIDNNDQSVAAFLEAERRIGNSLTLEFEGRLFLNVDPANELAFVQNDSFAALRLSWNL